MRAALVVGTAGFVAFWVYALFFASKDAINKIGDTAWGQRAEEICVAANTERESLIDLRRFEGDDRRLLSERAGFVDQATDLVERMLDDVVAVSPTGEKGRAIVPMWESDYRTYLRNRRDYADQLRQGDDSPFRETAVDGIPVGEKLQTFAADNEMPSCAPPTDLSQ